MALIFLRKYGVETTINFPFWEVDGVDFRVDAVYASGDVKIMKDEGAEANTTNGFADEGTGYSHVITATELQAARVTLNYVDQTGTKVWLDTEIIIETYGHPSAMHAFDFDDNSLQESLILQSTTIATLASQTSFTLTDGSADNDAYNGATIVIIDASTGVQKAFGSISDYVGSTKTVTLAQDPGIFTMATTDKIYILPSDVFAIWDRRLTGATHNIPTSAGQRLRQSTGIIMDDGTAQAGGVNTITLATGASATDRLYWQSYISIVAGTGAGQGHHILSYNGTTKVAVMDDDWVVQPDATSEYIIFGSGSHDEYMSGLAQAGAAGTITLESTATAGDDLIKNDFISIVSGTGGHQTRRVTAYNGTTKVATVSPDWEVQPDATSGYWILPQGRTSVAESNDKTGYSLAATGLDAIASTATGVVQIAKAIWDRVISKANHNVAQSAGKVVREGFADTFATGTAQAGGVNTVTLEAGASALDDIYIEQYIMIVDGTGVDQGHHILAYDGTTKVAVVDDNWITQPDATSEYVIKGSSAHVWADAGVAQAGGATSITLNGSAVATDDYYNNMLVYLHSGTGFGQARRITDYNGTTKVATVGTAWTTNPDNTTGYSVESLIAVNNEDMAIITGSDGVTLATSQGNYAPLKGGTAMTESYAADGSTMTPEQALYQIWQLLSEFSIAGTTITVKKLDGSTTAMTFTLDDGTAPTALNRTT